MALELISVVGASNSNTFATVADFIAYCEQRPHLPATVQALLPLLSTEPPDATALATVTAGLLTATRLIQERVEWTGNRTYPLVQALSWPRQGVLNREQDNWLPDKELPQFLIYGQCELTIFVLAGDRLAEPADRSISELDIAGAVSIKFDKQDAAPVIPDNVWAMFYPFAINAPTPETTGGRQMRVVDVLRT